MRLEETLIVLLQGVSQQAVAKNAHLNQLYESLIGKVVRIRFHDPYLHFYVIFTPDQLEFASFYEGHVDEIYNIDTQPFVKALYLPASWHGIQLESLLKTKKPSPITSFLILLCQNWDFWNLLQLICSELMPWINMSQVTLDDLQRVKRLLDQRLIALELKNETLLSQQNQMQSMIGSLQQQVKIQSRLITIFGAMTTLILVLSLWSHSIA